MFYNGQLLLGIFNNLINKTLNPFFYDDKCA